jgi:hypothetical protein
MPNHVRNTGGVSGAVLSQPGEHPANQRPTMNLMSNSFLTLLGGREIAALAGTDAAPSMRVGTLRATTIRVSQ